MTFPYVIPDAAGVAARLDALLIGGPIMGPLGEAADMSRTVVGHRVEDWGPGQPGIVQRWRYADRPDLGEFGGGFMHRDTVRRILRGYPI